MNPNTNTPTANVRPTYRDGESIATMTDDAGARWLMKVRRAADRVLGGSPAGREVMELCIDHDDARDRILTDRTDNLIVIAVVGATGQGKSWLVRQMIRGGPVESIASGNSLAEATEKLTWIGPRPPADLDNRHEQFIACGASHMMPIGAPYLLVDAPGATDDRQQIARVAERALSMAGVLVLVVRRDQIRSQRVSGLTAASEGTIVVPVINAIRQSDDSIDADVESLVARLRSTAPHSVITTPVLVPDFDVAGDSDLPIASVARGEGPIGRAAAADLTAVLTDAITQSGGGDQRRSVRLMALDARFTAAVASVLQKELPDLTIAVQRLDDAAAKLPGDVARSLLGGSTSLRAAIRGRLRLNLLTETAAIFFPYRSVISLLNLTHGAWDRVMLSMAGSLPSLLTAAYAGVKNFGDDRAAQVDLRDGLRQRTTAAVTDRLSPMARRFRHELKQLQSSGDGMTMDSSAGEDDDRIATLAGIDSLQEQSQAEFDAAIDRETPSRALVLIAAVLGTVIFWGLASGPLVSLYRDYLSASSETWRQVGGDASATATLDDFPRPDASFLITGLLLSLLPTSVFSMIVLTIVQSRRRVNRIESAIHARHDQLIQRLQKEGVLRLSWSDPLLADAEFLLSIGRHGDDR